MKPVLLILLVFAGLSRAFTQSDTPAQSDHVDIKFSVVGWGQEITDLEYPQGGSLKPLGVIPLFAKSKPFVYSGPTSLAFYRKPAAGMQKSPEKDLAVATALIPPGLKRALILMSPQGDRYQAMVVPDDLDAVPGGQALVVNLCKTHIAIRTNKTDLFTLAPGERKLVSPGGKNLLLLQMEIGIQEPDFGWKKSDNCFLPLPSAYQTVIFFLSSDSAYFKDIDGHILKPTQMVVLREPIEKAPKSESQ